MKHLLLSLALSALLATTAQAYEITTDADGYFRTISGIEYEGQSYSVNFEDITVTATEETEWPLTYGFTADSFPERAVSREIALQVSAVAVLDIINDALLEETNEFKAPQDIYVAWSTTGNNYLFRGFEQPTGFIYVQGTQGLPEGETTTATFAIVTPDEDTETSPVPVPSSLVLLAMGMLTLTGARKYRMSGNQH